MKYRKKPVVIEALRLTKDNIFEIMTFMGTVGILSSTIALDKFEDYKNQVSSRGYLAIETPAGTMKASVGDYIIKGVKGEFYPCKPDIFKATYEKVRK